MSCSELKQHLSSARDISGGSSSRSKEYLSLNEFIWGRQFVLLRKEHFDISLQEDFWSLNNENESLGALLLAYVVNTGIQAPTYYDAHENCHNVLFIIPAIGMATVLMSMWISLFYQCFGRLLPSTGWHQFWRRSVPSMRIYTAIGSSVFFVFRLIVKSMMNNCQKNLFAKKDWNCVSNRYNFGMPAETQVGLLLFPLLFSGLYREIDVRVFLCLWAMTIISNFVAIKLSNADIYYPTISIYIIPSLLIIFESYRYNRCIAMTTIALKQAMREKDENADQVHAAEMRHMIANVAHDLKTPLTSFLSGIELISDIALECQNHISENSMSPVQLHDNVISILNCLANIRNTNSFMLMTINRCIDYTKASKGLKLVPKYETIDLMETLSLPLNCMKDIQQRVSIVLEPLSRDICSHVITDKQWLQENVLCLLSNAVKYSSEGEVKVMLRLIGEEEANPVKAKDNFLSLSFKEKPPIFPVKKRAAAYQVFPVAENSLIADDSTGVLESSKESGDQFPTSIDQMDCGEKDPKNKTIKTFLLIEIEDNGIGLSEEAMSNLFNPFKQAQRLAGGTGLGLYSLARRVEALNGQYGVSNRRDGEQGCMFWFSIPYRPDSVSAGSIRRSIFPRRQDGLISSISAISEAEVKAHVESGEHGSIHGEQSVLSDGNAIPPSLTHDRAAGTPTSASLRMITKSSQADLVVDTTCNNPDIHLEILVADDAPAIVKMTSMMLKRLGHRITCAENGDVALKKIWEKLESSKRPFDVVLMDLQMPVMDGLEATRRLRAFELAINSSSSDNSTVFPKRNLGLRKISIEMDRSSFLTSSSGANPSSVGNSSQSQAVLRQLVIGVSANSDYETMQDALNAGVDAFMAKPFSIETFYDTYEKLKDNRV